MRLLVIGASGLVGGHVLAEALARGVPVLGTYRSRPVSGLRALDLADATGLPRLIEEYRPTWVLNAGGWSHVDGCEEDPVRARSENITQPMQVAAQCAAAGVSYCHVSTAYVFDGCGGPYREEEPPAPLNVYARCKLEAERCVQSLCSGRVLVPRLICVWGNEARGKNFVYQVASAVREGRVMRLPGDQSGNPSWAGDVAAWMLDLMQADEVGTWHLGGQPADCSRGQWVDAILSGLRARGPGWADRVAKWRFELLSTAALGQAARRPLRGGMDTARIQARFPRLTRAPCDLSGIDLGPEPQ